ncbi:extended synaptotagmin-3 [Tachyglossus aculeatus]|uniref:extended synaptotagmin-3 n=1 Tax=Tachyglossus aculeatus TaxID=9261 RepID=UPI0018F75FA9|nr:extended synaptotagmin-3 [Tachyglossus aculeatus]
MLAPGGAREVAWRALAVVGPALAAGVLGPGPAWLVLLAALGLWWFRNSQGKSRRLHEALRSPPPHQRDPQHLRASIHFPDMERVEWVNKIVAQIWPYLGMMMEKKFRENLEPKIREKSSQLRTFTFTKLCFGGKCPKINGVKAHANHGNRRRITLDLQICYIGDCEISVELQRMRAGISGIQLQGTLRVILEPLLIDKPFLGAVTIFFLQKPHLEINWTGLTNFLDAPGINEVTDGLIEDLIAAHLVLPNRVTVPVKKGLDVARLRFPLPCGVIRVFVLAGEQLAAKDGFLGVRGKSDPYAVVRLGPERFRTRTVRQSLDPLWHEVFEFIVYEVPGQDLEVDLYDEDPDKDDFLGSLQINLGNVKTNRTVDEWFPLSDTPQGRLHLRLEWMTLVAAQDPPPKDPRGLNTAILIVFLESACNLPRSPFDFVDGEYRAKKLPRFAKARVDKDPSAYVKLSVGRKIVKSKTCANSKDPVWNQVFTFFVGSVEAERLHLKVMDDEQDCVLGVLEVGLVPVLAQPDSALEERFQLARSGLDSLLTMKLVLRVLQTEEGESGSPSTGPEAPKEGPVLLKGSGVCRDPKGRACPPREPPAPAPPAPTVPAAKGAQRPGEAEAVGPADEPGPRTQPRFLAVPRPSQPLQSPRPLRPPGTARAPRPAPPSLGSLGSLASSCFELSDDNLDGQLADLPGGTALGEVQLSVRYAPLRRCLVVLVCGCRNLLPCGRSSVVDAYVRVYLLPDRGRAGRKRTSIRRRTVNPQYDERFEFSVGPEEVTGRSLDVAVKNSRRFGGPHRGKSLGQVLIDFSGEDLIRGFTRWWELTPDGRPRS